MGRVKTKKMRMFWIFRLFGLQDKKQKQKSVEVSNYVVEKKSEFTEHMTQLHKEIKEVHKEAKTLQKKSVELVKTTDDITRKISIILNGR